MRRALKWAVRLAAATVAILAVCIGALLTAPGQRVALHLLTLAATNKDGGIEFGRLDGSLFSTARIERIVLRDRDGPWLEARDVSFSWHPLSFAAGQIEIEYLVAGAIEIARKPVASAVVRDSSTPLPLFALFARRIEVSELILNEPVAGVRARLKIEGNADFVDRRNGLSAKLVISRLDAPGGHLEAKFAYRPDGGWLEIDVAATEPADGLTARLLELPGLPPLSLTLTGGGRIDEWRAQWALSSSEKPFAAGTAAIDRIGHRHKVDARFEGYLEMIAPADLSGAFAGKTSATLSGFWTGFEHFDAEEISLSSDSLQISAVGGIDVTQSYAHGTAAIELARADNEKVSVPLSPEPSISVDSLRVRLSLPNNPSGRRVTAEFEAKGIAGEFGSLSHMRATASAHQANPIGKTAFDAHDIQITATADGLQLHDAALVEAIGTRAEFALSGQVSSQAFTISTFQISTTAASLIAHGQIEGGVLSATTDLSVPDLSRFSGLAGRPLGGRLAIRTRGKTHIDRRSLQLSIDGTGEGLHAGNPIIDRLLAGTTRLTGAIALDESGEVVLDALTLSNTSVHALVNGRGGGEPISLDALAEVHDLSTILPALSGSAILKANLDGTRNRLTSRAAIEGYNVFLHGRKLNAPSITFLGRGAVESHAGVLKISGDLDGEPVSGSSQIAFDGNGGLSIDEFKLAVAAATATGALRVTAGDNAIGSFTIDFPRLAELTPLYGEPLDGTAKATIMFGKADGKPTVSLRAEALSVQVGTTKLHDLNATAEIFDYADTIRVSATARLAGLDAAGFRVRDLRLDAKEADGRTGFQAAAVINDNLVELGGYAAHRDAAYQVELSSATLRNGEFAATIEAPALVSIDNASARFNRLIIKTEDGRTEVVGSVGPEKMDLSIALKSFPAAIVNAFDPTLGLEGHLDGKAVVRGTPAAPLAHAAISWRGAAARLFRTRHLPPLSIDFRAELAEGAVKGEVTAGGFDGLAMTVVGTVGTARDGRMEARVEGSVPLALANGALADRAARVTGTARVKADIAGALVAPHISGDIRITDATFTDPSTGLALVAVAGSARFTQTTLWIDGITGSSAKGGVLSGRGKLSQAANGTMVAELGLDLDGLTFDDHELMSGKVGGNITLAGPIHSLNARGVINVKRLDVIVPNQLPRSIAKLELRHVNAPETRHTAREQAPESSVPINVGLDLKLEAADRIFVRGRGLDAQLGGALHVRGTTDRPIADGGFAMERGRFTIVGRQLDFTRGKVFFGGSVEPQLEMEATAAADGFTISVFITGPASKPTFRFLSVPGLPEDEVVARLLFNKSLTKLSPLQLAQLANEIDKIGGLSSGPGALDQIKGLLGIDVLDVTVEKQGAAAVSAGSYVNENTYIGVRQGTTASSSRVIIDHNLTKNLKARGELGADGNSKVGLGVEWDY